MKLNDVIIQVPIKAKTDIEFLLKYKKPTFPCNVDYLLYIVGKLIQIPQFNAKLKNLNKVPMYSVILRYELGKNYKKYLDYLIDNKVIETDNHYIVSSPEHEGKCKCYGLTKKYRSSNLVDHAISKKSLLKQILKWKEKVFNEFEKDELLLKLYGMMDGFTIDIDSATNKLDTMLENHEINQRQRDIEVSKCQKINNKKETSLSLFITKDSYDRVHTNFTNISKVIRENYLYHNGNKVIGVDIVSSQASLLCSLFTEYRDSLKYVNENPFKVIDLPKNVDVRDKYVNKLNKYTGPSMYVGINRTVNYFDLDPTTMITKTSKEISKYIQVMNTEGIYEFFQFKYDEMFGVNKDRKEVKKKWISYVFGKSYSAKPATEELYMIYTIWNAEFPMLNNILNHFKSSDYKTLAHTLQRNEANLIFNKVCPAIDAELAIEYCTVHDSIIVEEQYCEQVSEIFDRVLAENNIITYVKID